MHVRSLRPIITILLVVLLNACTPPQPEIVLPTAVEVPIVAEAGLHITLSTWPDGIPLANTQTALCRIDRAPECEVLPIIATSDAQGILTFTELPAANYYLLIDTGRGDFDAAIEQWAGESLELGDGVWAIRDFLGLGRANDLNAIEPVDPFTTVNLAGGDALSWSARTQYALDTLMLADSPLIVAHTVEGETASRAVIQVDEAAVSASIQTLMPQSPDYGAIRTRIGALTRDESRLIDLAVVDRWNAFYAGDDTAYSDGDIALIEALRSGSIYLIGDAYLTRIDVHDAGLVKAFGYMVIDRSSGIPTLVGVRDDATHDVTEVSTGYVLNVRDNPGEWIVDGPNGEQFYHYGWSYYHRWRRIMPDPLITVAEGLRTLGAANVTRYVDVYRQAADEYDEGDLTLIDWSSATEQQVAAWSPLLSAPPYLTVPDSGTIDVRRERFYEAVTSGMVQVDEESVIRFLQDERAENGFFITENVTAQTVIDALTMPYRAAHLYTDFEAAIILDATYNGEGPLVIRVTARMPDGAFVPRNRKELYFADGEVADVILGYSGTLIARWPHEMGHLLDFRDTRNVYPMRPQGGSRCEPFKYMMEYMWWVERFPYDAPDWDWQPVGSGLTLARLLTGTYPNSGC